MNKENKDILIMNKQQCPVCFKDMATFSEYDIEDAYAGEITIFSIKCSSCGFKNSDLEFLNPKNPAEYTIEISSKEDLDIRVIKSSDSEIIIPNFRISVDSSINSEGFISNIQGVLERFMSQINFLKDDLDLDKSQRKKLKNISKSMNEVLNGEKKIKLKLIDRSGNSAIISDKVEVKKLKKK